MIYIMFIVYFIYIYDILGLTLSLNLNNLKIHCRFDIFVLYFCTIFCFFFS